MSSNVSEVIRAVLNSLFIYLFIYLFLQKDFARTKSTKKHQKHQKHKKHKDTTKQKHKALQANKNKKCAQKTSKGKKITYSLICVLMFG